MTAARRLTLVSTLVLAVLLTGCAPVRQAAPTKRSPGAAPAASTPAALAPAANRTKTPPASAADGLTLDAPLPLDGAVRTGRLANGLRWYVRTHQKPEQRADLWLAVNAGSMQEDDDQQGLAHFVEHMAFNGTRRFAKQEIIDYLELIGMRFGPDVNAFTSFDETVYMLKLPTDDPEIMKKGFMILEDWARAVSFEDEEIDKERGVVLEEWRLGRGADARIRDKQFPVLFKGSRYAERLTIGKKEIIENAPYDVVRRYYRDWYRPDLMAVIAVGDFDPDVIERHIREHFSSLKPRKSPRPRQDYPVADHDETLVTIASDPEATRSSVGIYYKLDKRGDRTVADYRRALAERLYHTMFNARLDEIRQQADPPFLYAFSNTGAFVRTKDVFFQSAGVREGEFDRALNALLTEVERVDRHGFLQSELDRAKKQTLRRYEQAFKERDKRDSRSYTFEILGHFLNNEPMPGIETELELARRLLPEITLDELNTMAREWISESNRVIMASAPEKEDLALPRDESLLGVFSAVRAQDVEPYVDRVKSQPLVAQAPEPGRIVSETTVDEIGVTEWTLSNGARVVLKPTDFKNDQILLSGFSPGGTSLVPDAQYTSASFASSVLGVGGLGEFSQVELRKALAGKVAYASGWLGELEEGVRGSASPEDAETMFQLLYLTFTAPRADEEAYASWLGRTRSSIANRLARPETVFSDKMRVTMAQGHFRRRPMSEELLEEIDLDTARRVFRERFADAGDFTFILVGNFEPEGIKPLVLTWIGGLPSLDRQETWKDPGIRPPEGVVEFEVRKGLEPKSRVQIRFSGDAEWSRESQHDVQSLASVLRIRLREILREDMGGVYGVGAYGGISPRPRGEYGFTVSFGCAPENVEELVAAVFAEIERIKTEPPEDVYIEKVTESQLRERETDLKENGFWSGALSTCYRYGLDPRVILDHDSLVARVTAERIQASARKYLDTGRYVKGVLMPEGEE